MITKLLEAFFRRAPLVLLPLVLTPLVATAVTLNGSWHYEAQAAIWVERPTYLTASDDTERYSTPAQTYAGRILELLRTQSFTAEVARRTSLEPMLASAQGLDQIRQSFADDLEVSTQGTHLVAVKFRAATSQLSFEVVSAIVDAFQERDAKDRAAQATIAIEFYEKQVKDAETSLASSSDALRRFIVANPTVTARQPGTPLGLLDLRLAELQRAADRDQHDLDSAHGALDRAQLDSAASVKSQKVGFRIVDEPVRPALPSRPPLKKLLVLPLAAGVVGLGVAAAALALLVAGDRSVRSGADLPAGSRVIGVVPFIRLPKTRKAWAAGAARRAVGFAAGTLVQRERPDEHSQAA